MSRIIEFRTSAQKAERQSAQGKTCAFTGHRDVYKRQWEDNKFFSSKKKKLTKRIAKELLDKGWCRVCLLYTSVARTGLSTKDFIAPTSFDFREGKCFKTVSYTHLSRRNSRPSGTSWIRRKPRVRRSTRRRSRSKPRIGVWSCEQVRCEEAHSSEPPVCLCLLLCG